MGIVNIARAFLPGMIERDGGDFVITSSMQGITTGRVGPYAASKHAAASVAETTFADLRCAGSAVGVSCLCPSYTKNSMVDHPDILRPVPGAQVDEKELAARREVARRVAAYGLDARDVGDMVADAVGTDQFWVIPTPDSLRRVSLRADEIVHGRAPSVATT